MNKGNFSILLMLLCVLWTSSVWAENWKELPSDNPLMSSFYDKDSLHLDNISDPDKWALYVKGKFVTTDTTQILGYKIFLAPYNKEAENVSHTGYILTFSKSMRNQDGSIVYDESFNRDKPPFTTTSSAFVNKQVMMIVFEWNWEMYQETK